MAYLASYAIWVSVRPAAVKAGIKHQFVFAELGLVSLEPFPPAKETAVVEHVLRSRVQRPVVALSRVSGLPRNLDETVVKGEVVPDRILPSGKLVSVVGKLVANEVTYATKR